MQDFRRRLALAAIRNTAGDKTQSSDGHSYQMEVSNSHLLLRVLGVSPEGHCRLGLHIRVARFCRPRNYSKPLTEDKECNPH